MTVKDPVTVPATVGLNEITRLQLAPWFSVPPHLLFRVNPALTVAPKIWSGPGPVAVKVTVRLFTFPPTCTFPKDTDVGENVGAPVTPGPGGAAGGGGGGRAGGGGESGKAGGGGGD